MEMVTDAVYHVSGVKGAVMAVRGVEGDALEAALGLGDLAELTVNNDAEAAAYEVGLVTMVCLLLYYANCSALCVT